MGATRWSSVSPTKTRMQIVGRGHPRSVDKHEEREEDGRDCEEASSEDAASPWVLRELMFHFCDEAKVILCLLQV